MKVMAAAVLAIFIVAGSVSQALAKDLSSSGAESPSSSSAENPSSSSTLHYYFIGTAFIGVVIAILLSLLAQTKGHYKGGRTVRRRSAPQPQAVNIEESIKRLARTGPGGGAQAEELMQVFNEEMDRRLSASAEELGKKYNMIIDDKEKQIGVINQEYNLVKEEFQQVDAEKKHTESLVRSIADGLIVVNEKGEVQLLNPTARKLLGVKDEDDLGGTRLADNIKDDQLVSMLKGSSGDRERDIELQSTADDTKTVVRASSAVIEDEHGKTVGMVSVLSDITARKEAEEALRASESRLRKIIEGNADGMVVVDRDGVVRFLNRAAETLFGRRGVEFLGRPFGFPVVAGQKREIDIGAKAGRRCIAEIHAVEMEWTGKPALLVSLRDVTETVDLREQLRHLSLSDELTGLYNRRGFVTLAEQQLKMAMEMAEGTVLFFMDLDKMKWINDNLGHPEGDRALKEVSSVLKGTFRASDIIGRIGGDEFAVLVIEPAERDAGALLDTLQENVRARNAAGNRRYELSLSVGLAHYDRERPCLIGELMSRADSAMYEQKRAKQDRK